MANEEPLVFEQLMTDTQPSVKSLREVVQADRARKGIRGDEEWIKQMTRRGGFGGQFV